MSDTGSAKKPVFQAVQADELAWVESRHGDHHELRSKQLGKSAGGIKLGCRLIELAPRKQSWPHHFHLANEEAIYVLEGSGKLRLGDGVVEVRAGSYIALPAHPSSAHQMVNDSDRALTYLCFSTMLEPDVAVYPDTNKVCVFGGTAPGGDDDDVAFFALLRGDAETGFWDGEDRPVLPRPNDAAR